MSANTAANKEASNCFIIRQTIVCFDLIQPVAYVFNKSAFFPGNFSLIK